MLYWGFKNWCYVKAHTSNVPAKGILQRLGPKFIEEKTMIKYKGYYLYPQRMYNVLLILSEIEAFVIEIDHNAIGTDWNLYLK